MIFDLKNEKIQFFQEQSFVLNNNKSKKNFLIGTSMCHSNFTLELKIK